MLVIYLMVATLIGVILAPFVLVTVPSGYVGVLWKRFGGGTVLNPNLLKNEGMRITLPWNQVFLYDLRGAFDRCAEGAPDRPSLHSGNFAT